MKTLFYVFGCILLFSCSSSIENEQEIIENNKCSFILTRGKNKGNQCSKYCFLGYDYCKIHYKKV